jgi:hypothetical protein
LLPPKNAEPPLPIAGREVVRRPYDLIVPVDHDRNGYRDALREFLATLERRLEPPATFEDDAKLWCAAFLFRAQRLLLTGLHLTDHDEPYDGVGLLARAAYESAIFGAWLLGDPGRLDTLQGDLTRSHETAVDETWPDGDPPAGVAALLDLHRQRYPRAWRPTVKDMVNQVADWVGESEAVLAHRLLPDPRTWEPVRSYGEPYRSSYGALYRMLSTYEVHGAGTVQHLVDIEGRTVRPDVASRPVAEPTEVLVLVGGIVAHVASRLLGYRPLRLGSSHRMSNDFVEWEAGSMLLRAAARAVADDDPRGWFEFLGDLES